MGDFLAKAGVGVNSSDIHNPLRGFRMRVNGQNSEGISAFALSVLERSDQHHCFEEHRVAFLHCELELVVVLGGAQDPGLGYLGKSQFFT